MTIVKSAGIAYKDEFTITMTDYGYDSNFATGEDSPAPGDSGFTYQLFAVLEFDKDDKPVDLLKMDAERKILHYIITNDVRDLPELKGVQA